MRKQREAISLKQFFFSIKTVRFADYKATSASSVNGVQLMMDKVQEIAEKYGMKTNVMKTKLMKINQYPGEEFTIFLEGKQLSQDRTITTLGAYYTERIL